MGINTIEDNQVHRHRGPMRSQFQGGQRPTRMPMQGQPGTVRPNMPSKADQQQYYQQYNPAAAQQKQQMSQQPIRQPVGQEPLSTHLLAQASDAVQKQIIGERLFPLISRIATNDDVGKITGMMLHLENSELLVILENDNMLKSKVAEVTAVLHESEEDGPMRPHFQGSQRPTRMPMQGQPGTVHPNMPPIARQQQYNPDAAQQQPQMSQQPIRQPVGPLSTHLLAQASDAEQKQIIGERLLPLISRIAANEDVGKITGMLLQLDNSELWLILKNDDMLKSKVAEATAVLHGSQKEPQRD
uniref:PABC domain-containing protein n=1 Tax=Panagrolaimus davidi TaxID=227884 RepID=A0A914Q116_9BILA